MFFRVGSFIFFVFFLWLWFFCIMFGFGYVLRKALGWMCFVCGTGFGVWCGHYDLGEINKSLDGYC